MMGIRYITMLVMGLLLSWELMAQKEVAIPAFEKFWRPEFQVVEGDLKVYYDRKQIFLEIPENMLEREFCIAAQADRGFGWRNRYLKSVGVVRIGKGPGNNLCFYKGLFQERLRGTAAYLQAAFDASNQRPLGLIYPIVAFRKEDAAYVIDISKAVMHGDDWFQCRLEELKGLRSAETSLEKVVALKDGLCFTVRREYGTDSPLGGGLPLVISCVVRCLPTTPVTVRYADPAYPYASLAFTDYGKIPYGAVRDSLICRWRLSPSQPLVCYIDTLCPPEYISFVKAGVKAWEKAFERAGIRKAFQVRLATRSTDLAAEKWVISYDLGKARLERDWIIHPETGEIVHARLNIGHGVLLPALTDYWWICGASDKRICKNRMDARVAGKLLQHMVSREVGFLLGLLPYSKKNHTKESILKDLFYKGRMTEISEEDCRQLAWGYGASTKIKKSVEKDESPDRDILLAEQLMFLESNLKNQKAMFCLLRKQVAQGGHLREGKELYDRGLDLYYRDLKNMAELWAPETMDDILKHLDSCLWGSFPTWLDVPEFRRERWFDPENILRQSFKPFLVVMFRSDFLKGLGNESSRLLQELHGRLWRNFDPRVLPSHNQMEIQNFFLVNFEGMYVRNKIYECRDDYSVFWWNEWNFLMNKFREMSRLHQLQKGKDYYNLLLRRMERVKE